MQDRTKSISAVRAKISDFNFHNPQHASLVELSMHNRSSFNLGNNEFVNGYEEYVHDFIRDLNLNTNTRVDFCQDNGVDFIVGPYTPPEFSDDSEDPHPMNMSVSAITISYGHNMRSMKSTFEVGKADLIDILMSFRKAAEDAGFERSYYGSGNGRQLVRDKEPIELEVAYLAHQLRLFFMSLPEDVMFKVLVTTTGALELPYPDDVMVMMVEIHKRGFTHLQPMAGVAFCSGLSPTAKEIMPLDAIMARVVDLDQLRNARLLKSPVKFEMTTTNLAEAVPFMETQRDRTNYDLLITMMINKHYADYDLESPEIKEFQERLHASVKRW